MSDVAIGTQAANSDVWTRCRRCMGRQCRVRRAVKAPVTDRMLELVDIRPGDRVLELGAGPGLLGRRLADLTVRPVAWS